MIGQSRIIALLVVGLVFFVVWSLVPLQKVFVACPPPSCPSSGRSSDNSLTSSTWSPSRTFTIPTLGEKLKLNKDSDTNLGPSDRFTNPQMVIEYLMSHPVYGPVIASRWDRSFVQVGGGKVGAQLDSSHQFIRQGWKGLIIDGAHDIQQSYQNAFPQHYHNVECVSQMMTLTSGSQLLREHPNYMRAMYAQIDFDTWDCVLLEQWLSLYPSFRPLVWQLEVAYWIVPPVEFTVLYNEDSYRKFHSDITSLYSSCSLTLQEQLMRRHDYALIQLDYLDAMYVHRSVLDAFDGTPKHPIDVYRIGYIHRYKYDPKNKEIAQKNLGYYLPNIQEIYDKYGSDDNNCNQGGLLHFYWEHLTKKLGDKIVKSPFRLSCATEDKKN